MLYYDFFIQFFSSSSSSSSFLPQKIGENCNAISNNSAATSSSSISTDNANGMLEGTRAGTREGTKGGAREGANTDSMLLQTELVGRDSSPTRRSNTSGGSSGGNGGGGNGGGESSGSGAQVTARGPALTPMFKHHTLRCSFGEFVFLNAFVFGYYHQNIFYTLYSLKSYHLFTSPWILLFYLFFSFSRS